MAKQEAGGVVLYLSDDMDSVLPEMDDVDGTLEVTGYNEVQLVTLTGAPEGGTFTLTYSGQTTAAIAYDATAAAVQQALEALSNIAVGDVAVTGSAGGPWSVEFDGTLAETNVDAMTADGTNLTGGMTPDVTIGVSQAGIANEWTQYPPLTDDAVVSFVEESEDEWPIHMLFRTSDCVTKRGLDTIKTAYSRRDVDNWLLSLEAAEVEDVAAGAGQVGQSILHYGTDFGAETYRQGLLVGKTELGYWRAYHIKKLRVTGAQEFSLGHGVTKVPLVLKVFADEDLDEDRNIMDAYEMTAVASS
jgi:hypothetical protein